MLWVGQVQLGAVVAVHARVEGEGVEHQQLQHQVQDHHLHEYEVQRCVGGHQEHLLALLRLVWSGAVAKGDVHRGSQVLTVRTHMHLIIVSQFAVAISELAGQLVHLRLLERSRVLVHPVQFGLVECIPLEGRLDGVINEKPSGLGAVLVGVSFERQPSKDVGVGPAWMQTYFMQVDMSNKKY